VKSGLTIVPVATVEEVLKIALVRPPEPIIWEEPEIVAGAPRLPDADGDAVVTH
jgi:ATP-dependent Lon protease